MIKERTILGIDPGINILGFGVIHIDSSSRPSFVDMGVLDLRKIEDPYEKLAAIGNEVTRLCELYHPDDMAIEAPFYGKNIQVIFKLGRAQGVAISAARSKGISVCEYAPRKAKVAVCGNGAASKEQVALIVRKILGVEVEAKFLDATDALAIAMCHYYQISSPSGGRRTSSSWEKFVSQNPERVKMD